MEGVGQSFSLPFKSPGWFGTCALIGLIALIPIVGSINLLGWMLATLDNYRQGRTDLPPAGFQYIGRGVNVFVVFLLYGLVLVVLFMIPFFLIIVLAAGSSATGSRSAGAGAGAAISVLSLFMYAAIFVVSIVFYFFYPAIILAVERYGISGAISPRNVYAIASRDWKNTLLSAVLVYAANVIGGLGIYLCCVGIIVSLPLGYAIMAGILRYYEASFEAPLPPPAPPAAAPA